MKISKNSLKVLEVLARRTDASIDEISSLTSLQNSNISRALKELDTSGMITVRYKGHKKVLALASYDLSDLFQRALSTLPIKDLHAILSGNRLDIIALLGRPKTFEELTPFMSKINKKTIMNNIKFLLLRGIINQKTNGVTEYYVRANVHVLSDLARHIIQTAKETQVKKLFRSVLLVRVIDKDILVKTNESQKVQGYYSTCYNVFHKFGVNLILKNEYFWINREPSLEDVIVQTLKLDRDSTRGTIYVSALIYKNWSRLNLKKLRALAQRYRVDHWVDRLIGFVKSKGAKGKQLTQPEWSEVEHVIGG